MHLYDLCYILIIDIQHNTHKKHSNFQEQYLLSAAPGYFTTIKLKFCFNSALLTQFNLHLENRKA